MLDDSSFFSIYPKAEDFAKKFGAEKSPKDLLKLLQKEDLGDRLENISLDCLNDGRYTRRTGDFTANRSKDAAKQIYYQITQEKDEREKEAKKKKYHDLQEKTSTCITIPNTGISHLKNHLSLNNDIYCHQEFTEQLTSGENEKILNKCIQVIYQILEQGSPSVQTKECKNECKGWKRTLVQGAHFYFWWTTDPSVAYHKKFPKGNLPKKSSLFIYGYQKHSSNTKLPLLPNLSEEAYELLKGDNRSLNMPWTELQKGILLNGKPVKMLKGFPGTGKTTILEHFQRKTSLEHGFVLYLTFSKNLRDRAETSMRKILGDQGKSKCLTWTNLLGEFLSQKFSALALYDENDDKTCVELLKQYSGKLSKYLRNNPHELIAELLTNRLGRVLPIQMDGFYHGKEVEYLKKVEFEENPLYTSILNKLEKKKPKFLSRGENAWKLALSLCEKEKDLKIALEQDTSGKWEEIIEREIGNFLRRLGGCPDSILVDEIQDLLPLEIFSILKIAYFAQMVKSSKKKNEPVQLCLAGDQWQAVSYSGFHWGDLGCLLEEILFKHKKKDSSKNYLITELDDCHRLKHKILLFVRYLDSLYGKLLNKHTPGLTFTHKSRAGNNLDYTSL